MSQAFFPGFAVHRVALDEATIHAEVGGCGPPLPSTCSTTASSEPSGALIFPTAISAARP
jgi:hypothetical protein